MHDSFTFVSFRRVHNFFVVKGEKAHNRLYKPENSLSFEENPFNLRAKEQETSERKQHRRLRASQTNIMFYMTVQQKLL